MKGVGGCGGAGRGSSRRALRRGTRCGLGGPGWVVGAVCAVEGALGEVQAARQREAEVEAALRRLRHAAQQPEQSAHGGRVSGGEAQPRAEDARGRRRVGLRRRNLRRNLRRDLRRDLPLELEAAHMGIQGGGLGTRAGRPGVRGLG